MASKIIMFYGSECPHCHRMLPLVDKLVEDEGIEIEKLEVWHNEDNAKKMEEYSSDVTKACGGMGVPAFVKTESKEAVCGEMEYEELKKWVQE